MVKCAGIITNDKFTLEDIRNYLDNKTLRWSRHIQRSEYNAIIKLDESADELADVEFELIIDINMQLQPKIKTIIKKFYKQMRISIVDNFCNQFLYIDTDGRFHYDEACVKSDLKRFKKLEKYIKE